VLHSANTAYLSRLDDTDVAGLSASLGAKAAGARWLDELTADLDLDAFVLFSSISATWGSNDHGAYAAGNAYLDALAEDRRARGLPGTSIAWGVWDTRDWSAVDAVLDQQRPGSVTPARLVRQGMNFLDPDRALTALGQVLDDDETFLALADVDWARFAPVFSAARERPLLALIPEARESEVDTEAAEDAGELAGRLAALAPAEGLRVVTELVRSHAAAVLGHDSTGEVPATRAFRELGFDSLTAVELRTRLGAATGLKLPATVVFDYPNAAVLAEHVWTLLGGPGSGHAATLDEFDRLAATLTPSDDAARAEIAARLDALAQRFRARPAAGRSEDAAAAEVLRSATADEMFALLEDELDDPDLD
jgi:acyl carrier protein